MAGKITIKDIAERAGVSAGTVDRVLHNRPNVSAPSKEMVEKALKDLNYQPNMFASALASNNKTYTFVLLIPNHESETYWEEIEQGVMKAVNVRHEFNISISIIYYERFDDASFIERYNECLDLNPDGVIIVPVSKKVTRGFTDILHERNVPFILLDSNIPDLNPLSFWGQDSLCSGTFAAKILMMLARGESQIMLLKQVKGGKVTTKQQANREVGFKNYMAENFPNVAILELLLPFKATRNEYDGILNEFFRTHPDIHHCITFNSKAHIVGDYLYRNNIRNVQIMGYDMVPKNALCLKQGTISFIIAQHGYQQGYNCIDTLTRSVIMKMKVVQENFMPIELLSKENMEYYRRTQL